VFIQFVARILVFSSSRLEAGSDLCIEASQCSCLLNLDVSWFQLPDGIFPAGCWSYKIVFTVVCPEGGFGGSSLEKYCTFNPATPAARLNSVNIQHLIGRSINTFV
jgi:hypothetical protein